MGVAISAPVGRTAWMEESALSPEVLRGAYGAFPSGVTALCAMGDDRAVGMAASSFTSVSLEPALVSVCVARSSTTWPVLRRARRLGVSVLSEAQDSAARALAAKDASRRFDNIDWESSSDGAIFVRGSALWLDCSVVEEVPAGDHEIVVLAIERLYAYPDIEPIVFHSSRFRKLS
ncbi:flavin reductase family protein [Rhodococcus sp. NCIMB 12038]|uniref:flavin reductase family protein n=1 Tax=Rhodococcus sp. NCIMB 12038 TaxID=933800 RepID=UPI00211AE852|nr:flavin reductase family protein [Rhodococcus sp. NCIMB 12038]